MIEQLLERIAVGVGRLSGEHVIQRATQGIDVAADINTPWITGLLGRNVIEGPQRGAIGSQVLRRLVQLGISGQTQVDQFRTSRRRDDDVRRLDVAVNHSHGVGVDQRRGNLQGVIDGVGWIERATGDDEIPDIGAGDVLERDKVQPTVLSHVEDSCDVVVIQPRRRPRFIPKTLHRARIQRLDRAEHLQGHATSQPGITGAKNRSHSSNTNPLIDDEMVQFDTNRALERRGPCGGDTVDDRCSRWKQATTQCRTRPHRDRLTQPLLLGTDYRRVRIIGQTHNRLVRNTRLVGRTITGILLRRFRQRAL